MKKYGGNLSTTKPILSIDTKSQMILPLKKSKAHKFDNKFDNNFDDAFDDAFDDLPPQNKATLKKSHSNKPHKRRYKKRHSHKNKNNDNHKLRRIRSNSTIHQNKHYPTESTRAIKKRG